MKDTAHMVRWKGEEFGPFDRDELLAALAARKISLVHQIRIGSGWMPLHKYLEETGESELTVAGRSATPLSDDPATQVRLAALECQIENFKIERLLRSCPAPASRVQSVPKKVGPLHYASFWMRGLARLIDGVIVAVIVVALCLIISSMLFLVPTFFGVLYAQDPNARKTVGIFGLICLTLAPIVCWLYSAKLESSTRQGTIGKVALGLRVRLVNGAPITFWRATWRYLAMYLSIIPLGAGLIAVLFSPKRQAFHDMLAGTIVTRDDPTENSAVAT